MSMLTLLIVDQEPDLLVLWRLAFERRGYQVLTASQATTALDQLLGCPAPDAIIVGDLVPRPEASLGLVNDLRVALVGLAVPIIMVSTQVSPTDRASGLAAGADRYLTKPLGLRAVTDTVQSLLTLRAN